MRFMVSPSSQASGLSQFALVPYQPRVPGPPLNGPATSLVIQPP
jgi:hypothetical protein